MFDVLSNGLDIIYDSISFITSSIDIFISDVLKLQPFFDFMMDFYRIIPSAITDFIQLTVAISFLVGLFLAFAKG